jgi:glycosyltransferase involved in cell wall biosynthesis
LVAAEALARNLKFFGFDVGGLPDIVRGVDGSELVPAGNWDEVKIAIRRWIENGSPRPTSAAPTMRERYHPRIVARRHIEIYREVLSRSS